jgi:hypothetical protein
MQGNPVKLHHAKTIYTKGIYMNNKALKEVFIGALLGAGIIIIMLGIQAIANKTNGILFIGFGALLFVGTLFLAKVIKA